MWMGIDPGRSGSVACIEETAAGDVVLCQTLDATERDVSEFVRGHSAVTKFAVIEKVGATPQMGVCSAFTFGRSFGFLVGLLTAHGIAYELVSPVRWQRELGCLSRGDKNVTKGAAQRLFPGVRITHANADAILLAEYCRRWKG